MQRLRTVLQYLTPLVPDGFSDDALGFRVWGLGSCPVFSVGSLLSQELELACGKLRVLVHGRQRVNFKFVLKTSHHSFLPGECSTPNLQDIEMQIWNFPKRVRTHPLADPP